MTTATTATPARDTNCTFSTLNGRLAFYHANAKGTGAALRFDLKPAERRRAGCFYMELAHQSGVAETNGGNRRAASFDWENKATVKLGFSDICEFLLVLEGRQDCLAGDARGLYHTNGRTNTMIQLRRGGDRPGFVLAVSRKDAEEGQQFKGHITLSESEARGLFYVLQSGLFYVAMGAPTVAACNEVATMGGVCA